MAVDTLNSIAAHGIAQYALNALKGGVKVITLTGNITLDDTYPGILKLDPGGSARDVTLEGAAATDGASDGLLRWIVNAADAAENLVVKDGAASTIATINQNESAVVFHDADDGWILVAIVAIALS